jgi:ATP-dependent RNA helicase DDX19/DBP5
VQLLLFSATFNDDVRRYAEQIAPRANSVFVAKEELSLDVISQFIVK